MKKFIPILFLALLASCGGKPQLEASNPQIPIETEAGDEFEIVLEANPTTGYQWKLVGELDSGFVQFVKSDYVSTSSPNLVGGGGLDIWTFKAVQPGKAQVALGYYPPSNTPTEPQQTLIFTVIVK